MRRRSSIRSTRRTVRRVHRRRVRMRRRRILLTGGLVAIAAVSYTHLTLPTSDLV